MNKMVQTGIYYEFYPEQNADILPQLQLSPVLCKQPHNLPLKRPIQLTLFAVERKSTASQHTIVIPHRQEIQVQEQYSAKESEAARSLAGTACFLDLCRDQTGKK